MTTMSVADPDRVPGRDSDADTAGGRRETRWPLSTAGLRDLALALGLLIVLNVAAGTAGYWSADEAVSHQQVELLAEGRWTFEPPEPDIDPTGRWHTLNPITLGEGVAAPYVKHPLFPTLLRIGDLIAGRTGRHLIPAIGSVLAAACIAIGADRRRRGSARFGFWIAMLGTPLLFHGTSLWAHSLGIAAAAGTCLIIQPLLDGERNNGFTLSPPAALGFAALVAGGVLVRSEAAIYFVLLGCCLVLFGLLGHRREQVILGVIAIGVTLLAYQLDGIMRSAILGPDGDITLAVPPEPLLDLQVRGALMWTWLVGSKPDLGLGRIVGAILMAVAALSARPGRGLSLSPALGLIGAACYLPGLFSGSTMALFPTAPALLVGVLLLEKADRFVRLVGLLSVLYFGAVVATSYANGGGGDWGGRYLAMLLAPLAIVALPEIWHLGQALRSDSSAGAASPFAASQFAASPFEGSRPLFLGVVVASLVLAASMAIDIVGTRSRTADLAQDLKAEIEAEADASDLVVSIDGRIGRLLGDTPIDARLLQVPVESMDELADRLPAETGLLIVDPFEAFEAPDGWTLEQRSKNVIRVRR